MRNICSYGKKLNLCSNHAAVGRTSRKLLFVLVTHQKMNSKVSHPGTRNTNDGSQACWKSARERARLRARHDIRERVWNGYSSSESSTPLIIPNVKSNTIPTLLVDKYDVQEITRWVRNVTEGSVSSFSLTSMLQHASMLTNPIPISLMMVLETQFFLIVRSRFGSEYATLIQNYIKARKTCTFLEYAAWIGAYNILGAMLLGGIEPTRSGSLDDEMENCSVEAGRTVSSNVATRLGQRFLDNFPTPLKAYLCYRVVRMRLEAWKNGVQDNFMLGFGNPCGHTFSEEHFWTTWLDHVDDDDSESGYSSYNDIVCCPVCGAFSPKRDDDNLECQERLHSIYDSMNPQQRGKHSRELFYKLPATVHDLKVESQGKKKKRKPPMAASWDESLFHSVGLSQDVRIDKFMKAAEQGSYRLLRVCLMSGMEVDFIHEYGQTALYVACWRGHVRAVKVLLQFGANKYQAAHGGSNAETIARDCGHASIVSLLEKCSNKEYDIMDAKHRNNFILNPESKAEWVNLQLAQPMNILIPQHANHPGAGSYTIDEALHDFHIQALLDMQKTLPMALSDKKKKKNSELCSNRFYFCDSHGWIQHYLEDCISRNLEIPAIVLPHMRFLEYESIGTSLAPHVDLCRVIHTVGAPAQRSTHTWILYLQTCISGGETLLLEGLSKPLQHVLATVSPHRGRLLLFPHNCPHMGAPVIDVPKILLRGEALLRFPALSTTDVQVELH
jgi:Ankyrin repeats (3 copies)